MNKLQLSICLIISIVILSQADSWVPQIPSQGYPEQGGGISVDYIFYQSTYSGLENGYIYFHSKSTSAMYQYVCTGTDVIAVTKFKSILSMLLTAKTHGYKVYLHFPGSSQLVFDGVFIGD